MKQILNWMLAAILVSGIMVVASCSNNDNSTPPDTTALTAWQAGKTINAEAVAAYGGIDNCFAAEPIPDGVWQRMQGKTYKIDHDDLCFRLFSEAGFDWGGDWTTHKDYQHFELIEQ